MEQNLICDLEALRWISHQVSQKEIHVQKNSFKIGMSLANSIFFFSYTGEKELLLIVPDRRDLRWFSGIKWDMAYNDDFGELICTFNSQLTQKKEITIKIPIANPDMMTGIKQIQIGLFKINNVNTANGVDVQLANTIKLRLN